MTIAPAWIPKLFTVMALDKLLLSFANGVPRHRKKFLIALLGGLLAAYYYNRNNMKLQRECPEKKEAERNPKETPRVGVNLAFIQQLKKIIPICIPGKINLSKIVFQTGFVLRNSLQGIRITCRIGCDFNCPNRFGHLVHGLQRLSRPRNCDP